MYVIKQEFGERKDITIRGVHKAHYEVFVAFSKKQGLSTGDAFNSIMIGTLRQPWRVHGFRRRGPHRIGIQPEIISDLENLTVSKNDLVSAGEKTMFLFRNINNLVFAENVDAQTLVKHVKLIQRSNVTFPKKIPKLIQYGLNKKPKAYNHPTDKELLKDITIRNVASKLYDEFLAKGKEMGKTTGEFFSEILSNHIGLFEISESVHEIKDREFLIISREEELTITKEDLEILGDRGIFLYRIKKLIFDKNVSQEQFLQSIIKIVKSDEVILPTKIPRLIVLSRLVNCKHTNIT